MLAEHRSRGHRASVMPTVAWIESRIGAAEVRSEIGDLLTARTFRPAAARQPMVPIPSRNYRRRGLDPGLSGRADGS
jgi:hypothetical protein